MAWTAPSLDAFNAQFNPAERDRIRELQTDYDAPEELLQRVVDEVRDAIQSGGYSVDADTTLLPPGLHNDTYAITRWRLIASLPASGLETDARRLEWEQAQKNLESIKNGKSAVEPPIEVAGSQPRSGSWNSENKLIMRTHPVPRPGAQFPPSQTIPGYANPGAPDDLDTDA